MKYSPDILNCLANLSSDEVFTSPELANRMLDLLPQELFQSPKTRFLDPCSKSGVFLREITKRLLVGLEGQIPDLQERIDHVMTQQVFGIAYTDLTAEMSRRTLYCSKLANGKYSVTRTFRNDAGNVWYQRCRHSWNAQGRCEHCGASKGEYLRTDTRESYAYPFIHKPINEIFKMQFDVIIGNPPYQMNVGVEKENYAIAIYHKFVQQAKKLNPRYLCMIIPARWYAGGRGLDEFRDEMLHDELIKTIIDYPNSTDCFPGVDLAGGVCIFLRESSQKHKNVHVVSYKGNEMTSQMDRPLLEKGLSSFVRHNRAITILRKVQKHNEKTFDSLVGPQTPFGFVSSFRDFKEKPFPNAIKYYSYGHTGYISSEQVKKNRQWIKPHKVYISAAYGERGQYPYYFLGKPFYGEPNSCCSQTYLVIGPFEDKVTCENVMSYISTMFFRCMIMLKKNAQHNMSYVFECVPLQDFSHPWTDEMLYKKYGLDDNEIAFIESMIRPME